MDARPDDRLSSLSGLRFLAALGILFFHYGAPLVAGAPAAVDRVRTGGHVWVGLFYLLSGFVLARTHPAPMGREERRAFWATRLARLYPAYLLAFLLAAPFALDRWADGGTPGVVKAAIVGLATLLLVQAWAPPIARLWNAPGWSTSVVAGFYAAFPFLAAALARRSRRALAGVLALAWASSLALPLAYLALRPDGAVADHTWNEPFWLEALKFHPLARAGEFVFGVALGFLDRRGLARVPGAAAAAALAAVLALLAWGGIPYVLLHNGVLVPLLAVILLGVAHGRGAVSRALGAGTARRLGDAGFALYALQEPLWLWARRFGPEGTPSVAFVLAFSAAAIAASVAVSLGLERPARRALRAALSSARAPRSPSPAPPPGAALAPRPPPR